MTETLMSTRSLAEYLDVSVETIHYWNSQGGGPKSYKVGRHLRFRRSDVDQWLEERANTAAV